MQPYRANYINSVSKHDVCLSLAGFNTGLLVISCVSLVGGIRTTRDALKNGIYAKIKSILR